jgi:uridine monophosphate synthetase
MRRPTYGERIEQVTHPLAKKLLGCMEEKKTNVGVAADLKSARALLQLVHQVGPHICVLKTHVDILEDFSLALTEELQYWAERYQFLLFEDRKFADIGHTVAQQYSGGLYRIREWAHLVNAHILPGPGIIEGLRKEVDTQERGLLLLAQMSSAGNLLTESYAQEAVKWAGQYPDFVLGFIAQRRLSEDPRWLYFTPGIQIAEKGDACGQRYATPEVAIHEHGADVILVGRGIYGAISPAAMALEYQQRGWAASL